MPANPWELRADVRPLEVAADRWSEIALVMAGRAEELVGAARIATDGWDAAAAESFDAHRREVLMNLDHFTTLAEQMAGSLRAVAEMMLAGQAELDREWNAVALVPHDVVGESRHLVFRPDRDEDRSLVTRAQAGADDVRNRLAAGLEQEGERLRATRAELVTIRTELMTLNSTGFPSPLGSVVGGTGVGTLTPGSTSVPGSAQSGVAVGLPPLGPLSVSMPDLTGLTGLDASALAAPVAGAAAAGLARGARASRTAAPGTPPIGGMGAGAMGARAGSATRAGSAGRAGAGGRRLATPRLSGADGDDEQTRAARERSAEKDAKRATLEEKRAERAARRAARRAEREGDHDPGDRVAGRTARDRQRDDRDPADREDDVDVLDDPDELDGEGAADGDGVPPASADVPGDDRGVGRR